MFIEITEEAFLSMFNNSGALVSQERKNGALISTYCADGMELQEITNYYSKPITQYYLKDINA